MTRLICAVLALGLVSWQSRGDDEERSRRVRVALALSCGCVDHCDPKLLVRDQASPWLISVPREVAPTPTVAPKTPSPALPVPPPPAVVMPRIGVELDRDLKPKAVYGWHKGVRYGYPVTSGTQAELDLLKKRLEAWLDEQEGRTILPPMSYLPLGPACVGTV